MSTKANQKIKSRISQDSIPSFIRKTYDILEEARFLDIIDWNQDGTALVIKKPSEFCQKVLPSYFKHNNLTSFVRQLNMYNFHKRRTQNIDHVYFHELFQRGKKHLLKEIKRKSHENNAERTPKAPESLELHRDISSLAYENQVLKQLYNDAVSKANLFENQINDLTLQNQSLWAQLQGQNSSYQSPNIQKIFPEIQQNLPILTQEQFPTTCEEVYIPPLKLNHNCCQALPQYEPIKPVSSYLYFSNEDSGDSTEASSNSPNIQLKNESEQYFEFVETVPPSFSGEDIGGTCQPQIPLTSQASQYNEFLAPRKEPSVGQLFSSWNHESQNEKESFSGEKLQRTFEEGSILGKRQFESANVVSSVYISDPIIKKSDLSAFSKANLTSSGVEEKDFLRAMQKESALTEEYDMDVDLMDFRLF